MKLSKLKRLLDDIAVYGKYIGYKKCLLEDIVRENNCTPCENCEYSCFNRYCTAVGMNVLR